MGGAGKVPQDRITGGGEMGERLRAVNWASTPLGAIDTWPPSLKTAVSIMLHSRYPMFVWWGAELTNIYNDAYIPILGARHPAALGAAARAVWPDIWDVVGPQAETVVREGRATWNDEVLLVMERNNFSEETYFTWSYSPIVGDGGEIQGVFCACTEETHKVLGRRRLKTLRDLGERTLMQSGGVVQACRAAAETLAENPKDVPFALVYLLAADATEATLCVAVGLEAGSAVAPTRIAVEPARDLWKIGTAVASRRTQTVEHLDQTFGHLPAGAWADDSTTRAVVVPLARPGALDSPAGALVAGVSPRLSLDEEYCGFLELVAGHIATAIANARAYEAETRRAEALAEIDRAKTAFFSNVSHEFRTPLTLMLGPLEDALASTRSLEGERLEMTYRGAVRLLKLVNALLDFSRIEAGRVQASFEPTDLAALTRDLVSVFRAAVEHAGLTLRVECEPLPEPVYVDREMWEKIVLNLLSNALKFTFAGEIEVRLRAAGDHAVLSVRDTGIGIAPTEVPRLFERFHRIEGVRARTHEGSGIGLALVQELVRLHAGDIRAASQVDRGTTFTVTLPFGSSHLPPDQIGARRPLTTTSMRGAAFVAESLRWLPGAEHELTQGLPSAEQNPAAHVLLADDNADMREYVGALLRERWSVETVATGREARAAIQRRKPALVLADVMMPGLDGFDLLRELRRDPGTRSIPIVLLSARAGEESRIEGLEAGADDYLVKPFSARELMARVAVHLEMGRLRTEAEAANQVKDEFLAMLGHELRNPLAPMLTALELLRLRGVRSREQEILERQVAHLARLVDDLLDVSRITRGAIELRTDDVELTSVVARGIELASPLIEERHQEVIVRVPRHGLGVRVDEDRMAQAISNLLTNAAKYSDSGSTIVVAAAREGPSVRLSVKDEGVGIAPDMVEKIFVTFVQQPQTLQRASGGLGLGLTIVRSIVELHGGAVVAHSDGVGKGSEFIIELPAVARDQAPVKPPAERRHKARPASAPPGGKRILIVDDNQDAVETLRDALVSLGYEVAVAYDGPSALVQARAFQPNIALVDIGLPLMDGYALAQQFRALRGTGIRLVAVTGYGQQSDRRRATEAGFDRHLVKPVDLAQLEAAVRAFN